MQQLAQVDIGNEFFTGGATNSLRNITGIADIVSLFVSGAFILAGLILLFYFILGGIGMIASAGDSDPQKAEQAKKTVTSAVIGFAVVFVSYWIVKLIGELLNIPII